MKRLLLLGCAVAILAVPVACWLLYRECQWTRKRRWMGHYEQATEPWG